MICPQCRFYVSNPDVSLCPRCGQPLSANKYGYPDASGMPQDSLSAAPTLRSSGSASPGAGGGSEYVGYNYPSQSAPPGYPYLPPTGNAPLAPLSPPPRKRKSGLVISLLIALVVVLAGGLVGVSLYALNAHNHSATTSNTTSQGTVLFQDPLTSNTNGWADDSHCFFQGGSYHVKDGYICYAPAGNLTDANISVQVKQISGPLLEPYGIAFRLTDSTSSWYEFDIDSNSKWVFFEHHSGDVHMLAPYTPNAAIKGGLNTTNTLEVQARGAHFTLFVNGTEVGEIDDATFASGMCALLAGNTAIEVAFNNLLITAAS